MIVKSTTTNTEHCRSTKSKEKSVHSHSFKTTKYRLTSWQQLELATANCQRQTNRQTDNRQDPYCNRQVLLKCLLLSFCKTLCFITTCSTLTARFIQTAEGKSNLSCFQHFEKHVFSLQFTEMRSLKSIYRDRTP